MKRANFFKIPFDLELAKMITNKEVNGKIVTQDGHNARIVCFDYKRFVSINSLIVLVDCGDQELALDYNDKGKVKNTVDKYDLHIEVPTYYRDYSDFVPCKWQPCLVRASISDHWKVRVCADNKQQVTFYDSGNRCSGDIMWDLKLPLSKTTTRLMGTTKSYEELIQELDAELTATTKNEEK